MPPPEVTCLPDGVTFPVEGTLLEAGLANDLPWAHACGGNGECSTCRVWVLGGLERCAQRTEAEEAMAERLGFGEAVRLACQTTVDGPVRVRRLVLDDHDLAVASGQSLGSGRVGEARRVAVLFSDVVGFTSFSEGLTPYDVIWVLNRHLAQMDEVVRRHGGRVDNVTGDALMALFGVDGGCDPEERAVAAGLEMLGTADALQEPLQETYGRGFGIGVGVHCGEVVVGTLGLGDAARLTAIGDVVNVASRVEAATRTLGARLLVTEGVREALGEGATERVFPEVLLPGTRAPRTLYEVAGPPAG